MNRRTVVAAAVLAAAAPLAAPCSDVYVLRIHNIVDHDPDGGAPVGALTVTFYREQSIIAQARAFAFRHRLGVVAGGSAAQGGPGAADYSAYLADVAWQHFEASGCSPAQLAQHGFDLVQVG